MKTIYEPLFTQVGIIPASTRDTPAGERIERDDYRIVTEPTDEPLSDTRFPLPLYVIAAAALLG